MTASTTTDIPDLLAALPDGELARLHRGALNAIDYYRAEDRDQLAAWHVALAACLAAEIIRRDGGAARWPGDPCARLAAAAASLALLEAVSLGQDLQALAAEAAPPTAALAAALGAPIRAAIDAQYRRG